METFASILHLDDDPIFLDQVRDVLQAGSNALPCQLRSFSRPEQLLRALEEGPEPAVVILDIFLDTPGQDGRTLAKQLRSRLPGTMIIMCSDLKDPQTVRDCMARGADDFLFKGHDEGRIHDRIAAAWEEFRRRQSQKQAQSLALSLPHIVGRTASDLAERIPRLIDSALSAIHIFGETGTGKEIVGDMFAASIGAQIPFVRIHCGTFPAGLVESELFGHVKGAFTGAQQAKIGLLEQAHGGWVFLDEVATLSAAAQVALLRVLENQELRPVGASAPKKIAVRVLSATNEDLPRRVEDGSFRRDLWQRLCEAVITLPPLRERMEELEPLIDFFCRSMRGGPYHVSAAALQALKQHDWRHGNIRELRNCLRAMTEHAYGGIIAPSAIPSYIWDEMKGQPAPLPVQTQMESQRITIEWEAGEPLHFDTLTMRLLLGLVRHCYEQKGRLTLRQLAKLLDIPRSTLSTRLQELIRRGFIPAPELRAMVNISAESASSDS